MKKKDKIIFYFFDESKFYVRKNFFLKFKKNIKIYGLSATTGCIRHCLSNNKNDQ